MQTRWTAVTAALLAWPAWATAAPLDQAACDGLKTERAALVAAGIENDVERGPEWAKANNLAPDRLKQIERLIEVDEQLSFRCGEAVTARPTLKEPAKPVQAAAMPAGKAAAAGQAATLETSTADTPAKKKKKQGTAKNKAKGKTSAAAGALPSLSP